VQLRWGDKELYRILVGKPGIHPLGRDTNGRITLRQILERGDGGNGTRLGSRNYRLWY
jgi:hypothetical protein